MYKIVFLGINARYSHSNPAILYLKKNIDDLGADISLMEFTIGEKADKIAGDVIHVRPDVLAVSVYIWNAFHVKNILKTVKKSLPGIKIILGGPEVSFSSGEWIREFSEIDYIITGAGEAAFRELALSDFAADKKIITGNNPHFSLIRFPYAADDMSLLMGRYVYYESSRGCPFKCSYCLSSVHNRGVEFRRLDQVIDELDFFSSYRLPLIKFVDRTFNIKKDHYLPVWEHIVKKFSGSGTCFHFEIFPELLDNDDFQFLSRVPAGLFQFEMGIQSADSETLKEINRSGDWRKIENSIMKLAQYGSIHLHTDIIAGLPFEGTAGYADSFNKVYSLGAEHFQCGFLKVLPGTVMRSKSGEYGMVYSENPPYEIISNRWVTAPEMERLKLIGELVDLLHNHGSFIETEKFILTLYDTPFIFFNRMADFFEKDINARHRRSEYMGEILLRMVETDHPGSLPLVKDCLRWDWCSAVRHHHYPVFLKSELTIEAKRKGYRYFLNILEIAGNKTALYGDIGFSKQDLRRSIFFISETEEFMKNRMKDKIAMFLPGKQVLFCNIESLQD